MTDQSAGRHIRIVLVVAAACNGVIGANGTLPWRIPSDLKLFRRLTIGKPVIMGRKTFAAIGKPLDQRCNIVLTRDASFSAEGVDAVGDLEAALARGHAAAEVMGADEISIIGGADIYRQTLPMADRVYLTHVDAEPEGDAVFPDLGQEWRLVERQALEQGPRDEHAAELRVYDRIRQG